MGIKELTDYSIKQGKVTVDIDEVATVKIDISALLRKVAKKTPATWDDSGAEVAIPFLEKIEYSSKDEVQDSSEQASS